MFLTLGGWKELILTVSCVSGQWASWGLCVLSLAPPGACHLAITLYLRVWWARGYVNAQSADTALLTEKRGRQPNGYSTAQFLPRMILYRLIFLYVKSFPICKIDTARAFTEPQWPLSPNPSSVMDPEPCMELCWPHSLQKIQGSPLAVTARLWRRWPNSQHRLSEGSLDQT